jgi:hypothetical protein
MAVSIVMKFWYFFKSCARKVSASIDYSPLDVDIGESFEMTVYNSIGYIDDDISDILSIYSVY